MENVSIGIKDSRVMLTLSHSLKSQRMQIWGKDSDVCVGDRMDGGDGLFHRK